MLLENIQKKKKRKKGANTMESIEKWQQQHFSVAHKNTITTIYNNNINNL